MDCTIEEKINIGLRKSNHQEITLPQKAKENSKATLLATAYLPENTGTAWADMTLSYR